MFEIDIDKKATRKNARKVLETYRRLQRLSGRTVNPLDMIRGIEYDGMPRSASSSNGTEHALVKKLGDVSIKFDEEIDKIDLALEQLSDVSKEILIMTYCKRNKYSINDIAAKVFVYRYNAVGKFEKIYYSTKTIEKFRSEALIEFAEVYENGKLVVFKKF